MPRAVWLLLAALALRGETVSIPMRDGVRLAAGLYGADPSSPRPVILARTPYDKSGMKKRAEFFARAGYAVVIEDCRGRYASEGAYTPYNNDKQDGFDTLEWIAAQPWSNGKTAMFGGSHLGLVQWLAASTLPPGLVTIAPAFTASSQYGVAYRDGVLRLALISTGGTRANPPPPPQKLPAEIGYLIYHLPLMHLPLADLQSAYGWPLPWMTSLLRHPAPGGFWEQSSGTEAIPSLPYPTQLVTGYYDFFFHETLADFQRLRARRNAQPVQLIIGPWTHGSTARRKTGDVDFGASSTIDVDAVNLAWFDRFLKGSAASFPLVRYFSLGDNQWFEASQWPPPAARPHRIELGARAFESDPANPVPSMPPGRKDVPREALWSPLDLSPIARHPGVVTIDAPPLTAPLRIAGPVSAELTGHSDPAFADWVVRLFAVHSGGSALPLAQGIKRGRFPADVPITVDMGSTAALLSPGSHLRIELAGSSFPMYDRNPHTGEGPFSKTAVPARQTLRRGAIVLNVLP